MKTNCCILLDCKSKTKLVFLFALWFSHTVYSQFLPPICTAPERMTPTCLEACLICDINGFTGRNTSAVPGELPADFCTTQKHNGQWIGFMAGTSNLVIDLFVNNCSNGDGLEIGIYEGINCKNYKRVSDCNTDVRNNTTFRMSMSGLIVGQHYYLVIDGNRGDMCDYKVSVITGSTKVNPLANSGTISGPIVVCEANDASYNVSNVVGAVKYEWKLNSKIVGTGQSINLNYSLPGTYQLCVQASNACDIAPPECINILVNPHSYHFIKKLICEGECFSVKDTLLCSPGRHILKYNNFLGCDSALEIDLQYQKIPTVDIAQRACIGDTLSIGNSTYSQAGIYLQNYKSFLGCDSVVRIDLNFIECNIKGIAFSGNVKCHNDSNGSLSFSITQGTAPFTYQVMKLPAIAIANGSILNLNDSVILNNLSAGEYSITIIDNFGNSRILNERIVQPEIIRLQSTTSNYKAYNISCSGGMDGRIDLHIDGGTKPYNFLWDNNSIDSSLSNLNSGNYKVTVTDKNNCPLEFEFNLSEPPPLIVKLKAKDPNCDILNSGSIDLSGISGGVSPILISVNNSIFDTVSSYKNLLAGLYKVDFVDGNNCKSSYNIELKNPEHITIENVEDVVLDLGDSLNVSLRYFGVPDSILWYPDLFLNCNDCAENISKPIQDIKYSIVALSKDGCKDSIQFAIRIIKKRDVWPPNVFSPNGDNLNDFFNLFGTKQIKTVENMKIFSRWGELVYEAKSLEANNPNLGWNGIFRGAFATPGTYVWVADVVFLDGYKISLSGDINLLK